MPPSFRHLPLAMALVADLTARTFDLTYYLLAQLVG
jgi:hypothetical protein